MGHKHQVTDATRIQRLVDDNVSIVTLAKEFGVSKESIKGWLRQNSAPYWTRLACEALDRRRGKSAKTLMICEIPSKNRLVVAGVIKSLDGNVLAAIE